RGRRRHVGRLALAHEVQRAVHVVVRVLLGSESLSTNLLALRGALTPDARGPPPPTRAALPITGHTAARATDIAHGVRPLGTAALGRLAGKERLFDGR